MIKDTYNKVSFFFLLNNKQTNKTSCLHFQLQINHRFFLCLVRVLNDEIVDYSTETDVNCYSSLLRLEMDCVAKIACSLL